VEEYKRSIVEMRRVSMITQHVGALNHVDGAEQQSAGVGSLLAAPGVTTATLAQLTGRAAVDFGLEIQGYDLRHLAAADTDQLRRFEELLIEHRVLIFRGQRLSEAEELKVMKCLPHDARFRPTEITLLGNVDRAGQPLPDTRLPHGKPRQAATPANPHGRPMEYWHCDGAQNAMPQLYSAISAASAVARCGGSSTKFVSGTNALEVLPDDLRQRAMSLGVRNAGGGHAPGQDREGNPGTPELGPRLRHHDDQHGYSYVTNPLVRESPHGGSLWVSPNDMERLETIDGTEVLTADDSHKLLQDILGPGLANECALGSLLPHYRV
jgi:alpha-ketoglutarate-dependent taurine dioxygenase